MGYFTPSPDGLPISLGGFFLLLSMLGAALSMVSGWHFTQAAKARWRMRLAVLGFATLLVGWAWAGVAAEDGVWWGIEQARKRYQEQLEQTADPSGRRWLYDQLNNLDDMLKQHREFSR